MPTVTGSLAAVAVRAAAADEFTVASANLQRFFDTTNDPGVGDVVLTPAAFDRRLGKFSLLVRNVLRLPDIVAVQEVDNLATLQALATRVNDDASLAGLANPGYVAYLEEGNDPGGIDVGFLVKSSRVTVGVGHPDRQGRPVRRRAMAAATFSMTVRRSSCARRLAPRLRAWRSR